MSAPSHGEAQKAEDIPRVDVNERGAKGENGEPQVMNQRLFVQLLVFDCQAGSSPNAQIERVGQELSERKVASVLYEDTNAPRSIGVVTYSTDSAVLVRQVRPAINAVDGLSQRIDYAMLGRTYSQGYENDLQFWLIDRPKSVMENEAWPWGVWYPLRRSGAFAKLDAREQAGIMREHAQIGRAYGQQDLAHDVRLACHGMDAKDNEFIVGVIGKDLHPLSHVVQAMRKTRQTSEFIVQMGPFFVGYAALRTKAGT
ncbi:MAG: chlorite dismutase family protein [Polyangiaceae bacterium]|nr:chlorite dismutase family protein [Polyangiaceae bacterium]